MTVATFVRLTPSTLRLGIRAGLIEASAPALRRRARVTERERVAHDLQALCARLAARFGTLR
jgi:hypothetical protein